MLIYEVQITVPKAQAEAYRPWLVEHAQGLLALPGFLQALISEQLRDEPGDAVVFVVQYRLASRNDLDHYLHAHANAQRQAGIDRFGTDLVFHRRVLQPTHRLQALQPEDQE